MKKSTKVINAVGNNAKPLTSVDGMKLPEPKNLEINIKETATSILVAEENKIPTSIKPLRKFNYSVQFGLPVCGEIYGVDRDSAMSKLRSEIGNFPSVDITMDG